jgi:hypothetical protein
MEKYKKFKESIMQFDLNNATPLQAMQFLSKLKEELE